MRGFLLLVGMLFFAASMYLFYHPELLQMESDELTGQVVADTRPLIEKIGDSIHTPVNIEEAVQMAPVVFLFLSFVFAFASVLMPYGER